MITNNVFEAFKQPFLWPVWCRDGGDSQGHEDSLATSGNTNRLITETNGLVLHSNINAEHSLILTGLRIPITRSHRERRRTSMLVNIVMACGGRPTTNSATLKVYRCHHLTKLYRICNVFYITGVSIHGHIK